MTIRGGAPKQISASELAALQIDGLPTTKRNINKMAQRDGWKRLDTPARGGARLFEVAALPAPIREAIAERLNAFAAPLPSAANDIRRAVGRPKGTDYFTNHPDVADAVESMIARQRRSATVILDLLTGQFPELPHIKTLRRFIASLEARKPALFASMRDPDLYKGKYRLALGSADAGVTFANEIWELDTTKADVMCTDGRKSILGVIDRWSRRVHFLVADSESGQSVRRLMIDTIRAWGVMPETVVTDRGSGYINASIKSALAALGIEHRPCPPASGDKKPFIERVFGTFTRDRAELLDGYLGHNVSDAQRLRAVSRAQTGRPEIVANISSAELQDILNAWVAGAYNIRLHSGIGTSPIAKWQSSTVRNAAAPGEDVLRLALSALVGNATVGKRGVQWKKGRYWSSSLVPWVGRTVQVRRDEDDLGALFIFDEDGRYIDTAVNADRAGLSQEAYAAAARAQQAAWMREHRADVRQKQKAFPFEKARADLLRRDAENAGKLIQLPRPTEERATTQLASFDTEFAPAPVAKLPIAAAPARQDATSIAERAARAEQMIADSEAGREIDPQQLAWAHAFVAGPAYAAHRSRLTAFGSAETLNFTLHRRR